MAGGLSQRKRELSQRRKRKQKLGILKRKAAKATVSEKSTLAMKLRRRTPGAEVIIVNLGLEERK